MAEWSLIDYRKKQQGREFELSAEVTVIQRTPSNEEEVANTMRRHRANREINQAKKLDDEIGKLMEKADAVGEGEERKKFEKLAETKAKELEKLRDKGMDWLVENLRTQVCDPDGQKIAFTKLRQCFGSQDEVIALMEAMTEDQGEPDPQTLVNGSPS